MRRSTSLLSGHGRSCCGISSDVTWTGSRRSTCSPRASGSPPHRSASRGHVDRPASGRRRRHPAHQSRGRVALRGPGREIRRMPQLLRRPRPDPRPSPSASRSSPSTASGPSTPTIGTSPAWSSTRSITSTARWLETSSARAPGSSRCRSTGMEAGGGDTDARNKSPPAVFLVAERSSSSRAADPSAPPVRRATSLRLGRRSAGPILPSWDDTPRTRAHPDRATIMLNKIVVAGGRWQPTHHGGGRAPPS